MKALSIRQPWAWLIAAGFKDIENRSWPAAYRGRFLIHAGKIYDGRRDEWDWPEIVPPTHFDLGGIIGEAEIVDCVTESASEWFCGPYGFVIRAARLLPFQPYRGALGFFDIGPAEEARRSLAVSERASRKSWKQRKKQASVSRLT